MGLQLSWIEANLLDFFLADTRNSRGIFDEIKWIFAINPLLIASQLSLSTGAINHKELKILLQICLIASRINQKLKNKEGIHRFLKEIFAQKLWPFDPMEVMDTIARQSWPIT